MKYFLILWAAVFSALFCLFAAYPTPPAGYAYETDLRPHALVLTNATAAGLATRVDVTTNKPTAIYTPDGQTWTDATGCVWRIDSADCWRVELENGVRTNIVLRGGGNYWMFEDSAEGPIRYVDYNGEIWRYSCYQSSLEGYSIYFDDITDIDARLLTADGYRLVRFDEVTTNLVTRVAYTNELAAAALKPSAIYTPDGQTWTDATGCVWRIGVERGWVLENVQGESLGYVLLPVLANESGGEYAWELSPGSWRLYWKSFEWTLSMGGSVYVTMPGPRHLDTLSSTDEYGRTYALRAADLTITNLITRLATTNELASVAATIPERVTNTVRAVQGLVYDESLGITWRQTMYDGNLYYVAVTNANITEVQ